MSAFEENKGYFIDKVPFFRDFNMRKFIGNKFETPSMIDEIRASTNNHSAPYDVYFETELFASGKANENEVVFKGDVLKGMIDAHESGKMVWISSDLQMYDIIVTYKVNLF